MEVLYTIFKTEIDQKHPQKLKTCGQKEVEYAVFKFIRVLATTYVNQRLIEQ